MQSPDADPRAPQAPLAVHRPAASSRGLRTALGVGLLVLAVLAPASSRATPAPLVRTLEDTAGAEVRPSPVASWIALTPGTAVPSLSEVRSGDRPVRLGLRNGSVVRLAPHSNLAIMGTLDVDLGPRDGKSSATSLELRAGEVTLDVPTTAAPRSVLIAREETFVLSMPGSSVRVRLQGAQDDPAARLAVAVDSGEARVATTGAWLKVAPKNALELRPKTRVAAPTAMPAAPSWKIDGEPARPGPLAVVTGEGAAPLGVRWMPVRGALGYVAEVARDPAFQDVVARAELGAAESSFATKPLPAGHYHARVRAVGLAGFVGPVSAVRELRVARVELPPGAVERDGRWALPLLRPAKLDDPSGLELALGKSGFSVAPSELALRKDEPVLVQMRLRGERAVVPVQVVPRELQAAIEMSPKRAVWPTDPIVIAVRVHEGARDASVEPTMKVTIGVDEVPVAWAHEGALWHGTLAPRRHQGPCVVRVTATDPWGNEIGRSFLEVDSAVGAIAAR
jgi:hypothetical protein